MAEVNIKYNGSSIATMDASGTKTLLTAGKYCPANFQVEYNRPTIPDLPTDVPVFTVACNGTDWVPQNASCNMTYAEVRAWINQNSPNNTAGAYVIETNGSYSGVTRTYPVLFVRELAAVPTFTVYYSPGLPAYDLDYHDGFIYVRQFSAIRHRNLSVTRNGIQAVDGYVDNLNVETEYVIGLVRDANDNYAFTDTFAGITAAYESGQTLLVVPDDTLTDVSVVSVEYYAAPDPDTHPEDAGFNVTIIESESTMIPVPTPDDGTTTVENMRYSYYGIDLFYDDTIEVLPTSVYYLVDGLTAGTEAQPSDVPAGLVFINSNGIQVGTAT